MDRKEVMEAQSRLFESVHTAMKTLPPLGLYANECIDPAAFAEFVHHVWWKLSQSPKTLLLQSACLAFASLPDMERLVQLLHLNTTDHASIDIVGETIQNFSPGTTYQRLTQLQKQETYTKETIRRKVLDSHQKKGTASSLSVENLQEIVDKKVQKEMEARIKREKEIQLLESKLEHNADFQFRQTILRLWESSGAQGIWDNYCAINRMLSDRRTLRGQRFEDNTRTVCFDLITSQLSDHFVRMESNTYWWYGAKKIGEIDMVVIAQRDHDECVVAVCEMKSSIFEIGAASRQHEAKLALAQSQWEGNECTPFMRIGKTLETARHVDKHTRFFVATLVSKYVEQHVGAEPIVVGAICNGLRTLGHRISLPSNQNLCEPIVKLLLHNNQREAAVEYLLNRSTNGESAFNVEEPPVDLERLRRLVEDTVGADNLSESPLNCLCRLHSEDKLILLPANFTPKGCPVLP